MPVRFALSVTNAHAGRPGIQNMDRLPRELISKVAEKTGHTIRPDFSRRYEDLWQIPSRMIPTPSQWVGVDPDAPILELGQGNVEWATWNAKLPIGLPDFMSPLGLTTCITYGDKDPFHMVPVPQAISPPISFAASGLGQHPINGMGWSNASAPTPPTLRSVQNLVNHPDVLNASVQTLFDHAPVYRTLALVPSGNLNGNVPMGFLFSLEDTRPLAVHVVAHDRYIGLVHDPEQNALLFGDFDMNRSLFARGIAAFMRTTLDSLRRPFPIDDAQQLNAVVSTGSMRGRFVLMVLKTILENDPYPDGPIIWSDRHGQEHLRLFRTSAPRSVTVALPAMARPHELTVWEHIDARYMPVFFDILVLGVPENYKVVPDEIVTLNSELRFKGSETQ